MLLVYWFKFDYSVSPILLVFTITIITAPAVSPQDL